MGVELPTFIELVTYSQQEKDTNGTYQNITNVNEYTRWERLPHLNPPGIKLIRRGKGKQYLATISKTGQFSGLYASWEPILEELERQKVTNGGRRTNHNDVGSGIHPELAVGTDSVFGSGQRWEGGERGVLRNTTTNADMEA